MFKKLASLIVMTGVLALTGLGGWIYLVSKDLPDSSRIRSYRPDQSTQVLDAQGRVIAYLFDREHRLWMPLSQISENLQMAVIVAEDDTFFQHRGVNYRETWNALKEDLDKGRYARGGSTITQQLAKNIFLSKEKTLKRKVKEYFLAREIEQKLPKKRILELYLNEVEWGDGIYGAEAAARAYLGKSADQMEVHEAALLAAMLPNPKYFNPLVRPDRVKKRQQRVLQLMYVNKLLTREELESAQSAPFTLREDLRYPFLMPSQERARTQAGGACPLEFLRDYLVRRHGDPKIYRIGIKIGTALDLDLQSAFELGIQESIALPASFSDPWLLVMKVGDIPRAMICVEGGEESEAFLAHLQAARPSDALYDYALTSAKDMRWETILN